MMSHSRLFIIVFCLTGWGGNGSAHAADYFVDPAGDDEFDGLSETTAWQTISKVRSIPFAPGDSVFFKRGETWREELIVPESGANGLPLTFSAYGPVADSKPVISCADDITAQLWQGVIANGGFEQADPGPVFPGWTVAGSASLTVSQDVGMSSTKSARLSIGNPGGSASIKSVPLHIEADTAYEISGAVNNLNTGATIKVYLHTSNTLSFKYLAADGTWQLWIPNDSNNKVQPFFTASNTNTGWQTFNLPTTYDGLDGANTYFTVSVVGTDVAGLIDDLKIIKTGSNYWTAPRGVLASKILIEDGVRVSTGPEWDPTTRLHSAASASALTRYLAPGSSLPTDHVIEIGARRRAVFLDDKDYININSLKIEGCERAMSGTSNEQGAGILLTGGSSNNTVSDILAVNNSEGIRVQGAGPNGETNNNNIFTGFEIGHSTRQGIALRSYAENSRISNCYIHDLNMLPGDDLLEDKEPISIGSTTGNGPGIIVEHCEVARSGVNAQRGAGIVVFNSPQVTVRYNYVHDIAAHGIATGVNGLSSQSANLDGLKVYGNLVARTGVTPLYGPGQGIAVSASDHGDIDGIQIYNNTIIDCQLNDNKDGGISIRGVKNTDNSLNTITNVEIKNNIVVGCYGNYPHAIFVGSTGIVNVQTIDLSNNLYFPASTVSSNQTFLSFKGDNYTLSEFANYQLAANDADSSIQDPAFVDSINANADIRDYRLLITSPAINAGIDASAVGVVEDLDSNAIIGPFDVGAFEFQDDLDFDGIANANDNCPVTSNPEQVNTDTDSEGDLCDLDDDNDGLVDTLEPAHGTNPLLSDTDGDGFSDGQEVNAGTDPLSASSTPSISAPLLSLVSLCLLLLGMSYFGWHFLRARST